MNKRKGAMWAVVGVILVVASAGLWLGRHSMSPAKEFEVGNISISTRVLIATQGSEYKDALVSGIVDYLKPRSVYVKIIDVAHLPSVHDSEWSAIVILHTWQIGKPPPEAAAFVAHIDNLKKVIVVTTSGSGQEKLPGVDAISSASVQSDLSVDINQITSRLDAILSH